MEFKFDTSQWIQDLEGFIFHKKINYSQMKGSLRSADFSKITFTDQAKLFSLFDPSAKLSGDIFAKELDLYFKLKKDKKLSKGLPVFSDYVEWVVGQSPRRLDGKTLSLLFDKAMNSDENDLPNCFKQFITNLPEAFKIAPDRITNGRLNALIDILIKMKVKYANLPAECKNFIRDMYHNCSVREEISRRNRFTFSRHCENQEQFYDAMNKGFSGRTIYDEWIDSPSKNLTLKHMINYANYQNEMEKCVDSPYFASQASQLFDMMNLPYLPNPYEDHFNEIYLREPRDYRNYQARLAPFFKDLIESGLDNLLPKIIYDRESAVKILSNFARTKAMSQKIQKLKGLSDAEFYQQCASLLGDIVNLDKIFETSNKTLFDMKTINEKIGKYKDSQGQLNLFE